MKVIRTLIRDIQLKIVELLAFKLKSLHQALHHHHTLQIPNEYENAKA